MCLFCFAISLLTISEKLEKTFNCNLILYHSTTILTLAEILKHDPLWISLQFPLVMTKSAT